MTFVQNARLCTDPCSHKETSKHKDRGNLERDLYTQRQKEPRKIHVHTKTEGTKKETCKYKDRGNQERYLCTQRQREPRRDSYTQRDLYTQRQRELRKRLVHTKRPVQTNTEGIKKETCSHKDRGNQETDLDPRKRLAHTKRFVHTKTEGTKKETCSHR